MHSWPRLLPLCTRAVRHAASRMPVARCPPSGVCQAPHFLRRNTTTCSLHGCAAWTVDQRLQTVHYFAPRARLQLRFTRGSRERQDPGALGRRRALEDCQGSFDTHCDMRSGRLCLAVLRATTATCKGAAAPDLKSLAGRSDVAGNTGRLTPTR